MKVIKNNLHTKHNKAMAHINFMGLHKENSKTSKSFMINKWPYVRFVLNLDLGLEDVKKRPRQYS